MHHHASCIIMHHYHPLLFQTTSLPEPAVSHVSAHVAADFDAQLRARDNEIAGLQEQVSGFIFI